VLKSIAGAFNLTAETLLEHAGVLGDEAPKGERSAQTEAAIRADDRLTGAQKEALLSVYRSFATEGDAEAGH
jgi:hypothetical protein